MNDKVLKDLYDRAVSKGYNKSQEEFVALIQGNQKVLDDNYKYVQSKGYSKSKDDFASLVGYGSVKKKEPKEPTESPSTTAQNVPSLGSQEKTPQANVNRPDWVVLNVKEAETAPLENLKGSIEYYLDFYKDAPFSQVTESGEVSLLPRGEELKALEDIYNKRIRTEGKLEDRVVIANSDVYQDFIKENLSNGLLNEEEISLPQNEIFELVASRITDKSFAEQDLSWGPVGFRQETETEPQMKQRYNDLNRKNIIKKIAEETKERILSQIPEDQKTPEQLEKVEERLWVDKGIKLDLTGDKRYGSGNNWLYDAAIAFQKETENIALSLAALGMEGSSPTFRSASNEVRAIRESEMERLGKKLTQIEGDISDNLAEGNLMNAASLTMQQVGSALPLTVATAATGGAAAEVSLFSKAGLRAAAAPLATLSGITGVTQYQEVRDEDWFKNNLNDAQKLGYLAAYGFAEGTDTLIGGRILKQAARQGATAASAGAKEWLKDFFIGMGYNVGEEALSEGITGVIQYTVDEAARGNDVTFDGILDAFKRNAVAGAAGGAVMGGTPRLAAKGWSLALRTPEFIGMKNTEKKIIEDIQNTENEAELEVLTVELEQIQQTRANLFKNQKALIDSMSEEDANAYAEAITNFNAYRERLSEMDEKSNAYQIAEKKAQEFLEQAQDIKGKYEGVQQTEAFMERERDEFSEQDLIELEKKIESEERTKRDRQQPERTPRPKQVETPEQEKKITALEMLGEKVQDENGVIGTITEENGSIIWESEDGSLVREGGSVTDAETVTLDDMRLSLIPESPTTPVELNKGEPSEAPKPREKGISKEELEVMDEIEFEEKVAQSEREVAEFEDQVLDEVAKKDTNQDLVEVKGNVYQVTKKKDGSFTVSKMREDGRLIRNTDKNETTQAIAQFKRAKTNQQKRDLAQAEELISEFKKEQDDKILSWLETKIKQTDTRGRAFDAGLGIPMFAANSALKIVRASYKAGKALAEAIEDGINYLKRNGYNVDPTEFKKYILQQSKQQPNAPKKPSAAQVPVGKQPQTSQKVRGQNTQGQKTSQKGKAKTAKQAVKNAAKGFTNGESFGKQVQEALKPFTKGRGKITNSQASTLAKRAANVRNQAQLDKFLEYAEKVLSRADFIGNVKQAKSRAKTARNRYNSGKIVSDNGDILRALTLDPESLSNEELDRYNDFLARVNSNTFERLAPENIEDIEFFNEKYQPKEKKEAKEQGEKAKESLNQAQDALKESIKQKRTKEADDVVTNEKLVLAESLTDEEIESLSKQEAEAVVSSLNDVDNGGTFTANALNALNKIEKARSEKEVVDSIEGKAFKSSLRAFFNPKTYTDKFGSKKERIKALMQRMSLNRIDSIVKGAMDVTKPIYRRLIQPVAKAYSMYEGDVRSFERDMQNIIKKIPKKQRRKAAVKLALIGLAKQKAMNPKDEKLSSVESYMKAIEEDGKSINSYKDLAELYTEVYNEMKGNDDAFDWEKAFNNLSFEEKLAFNFIENHYAKQARKVQVASAANNDGTILYEFYNPIKVVFTNKGSAEEVLSQADRFINDETPPKSPTLNQRKGSEGQLIYLEFFENARTSTRSVLRDYYLRQPLKLSSQVMKGIIENKKVTGDALDFVIALNETIKEITENVFLSSEYDGNKFVEFIRSRGYERDLVSAPRAGVELMSNVMHAAVYSPKTFAKGAEYLSKTNNRDLMRLANEIGTTQFSRLFQGENISPRAESGSIGERSLGWWDDMMKSVSSGLLSKPDTWVAKPLWIGSFLAEFKKVNGKEFDADAFMEDAEYRKSVRQDVNKARDNADGKLAQGFASMNPYEGVVASQIKKTDNLIQIADKYMTRFVRFEFQSAVDAINAMVGRNEISKTEGFRLLVATMLRMTAYQGSLMAAQNVLYGAVESLAGAMGADIGDREEESLEKLLKSLQMGALSSAMTLLVLRRLGNFARIPIVAGVETLNYLYGDDIGLRDSEDYNNFEHSILYSPAVSAIRLGADYRDMGKVAVDLVASAAGPTNKIVKGVGRGLIDTFASLDASKKSTKERRAKQASKNFADVVAATVGIPLSRDLMNLYSREVYEDYVKDNKKKIDAASDFKFEDFDEFSFDEDFD